jgi:hypothetical protein
LRSATQALLDDPVRRAGSAVIFDMDHTEGTYASAELLKTLFDRVFVITPREYIAQKTALVTRQGIIRRFHDRHIDVIPLAEPRWSDSTPGKLAYANVNGGEIRVLADVALVAYSTPRVPQDELAAPLRAAGLDVRLVGDCALPQGLMAATADAHALGMAL